MSDPLWVPLIDGHKLLGAHLAELSLGNAHASFGDGTEDRGIEAE